MKKIYMNPTMTIVKIQTTQMLAASADIYGIDATGEAMSRDMIMEDELEEDEYNEEEDDFAGV